METDFLERLRRGLPDPAPDRAHGDVEFGGAVEHDLLGHAKGVRRYVPLPEAVG